MLLVVCVREGLHKLVPVVVMFGNIVPNTGDESSIVPLGLSICLGMIRQRSRVPGSQHVDDISEQLGRKLRSVIGQQLLGDAVGVDPIFEKGLTDRRGRC